MNALLSRRELQVLRLVVENMSDAEVGRVLGLSPETVGSHRRRIMKKLGATDLQALIGSALQHGITPVE